MLLPKILSYQRRRSTKNNKMEVILCKSMCVPSMKTAAISANEDNTREAKGCSVYLVFNGGHGKVLGYPFSCCGHYDGRTFCSPLLAKLLAFWQVQQCKSIQTFEKIWPLQPTHLQGIPTLFECVCTQELDLKNLGEVDKERKHRNST